MADRSSWAECRMNLESVFENTERSLCLLETTVKKLSVLMAAIKDNRHDLRSVVKQNGKKTFPDNPAKKLAIAGLHEQY